ncbi:hypothetical protein HDU98_001847 [Podochytrium sp. JEL0797]|nr:hypothetical protein HDU98_001847 [Podochytrium sp. JEL0797]
MWSDNVILLAADGIPIVPLRDTFYEVFIPEPFKKLPVDVVNVPVSIGIVGALLFSGFLNAQHGDPLKKIRRTILILSIVYFCRMISIAGTRLTPVNPSFCRYFPRGGWNIVDTSLNVLTCNLESCSDMMFSGHTAILSTFITRLWFDLKPMPRWFKYSVRFLVGCMFLFAIAVFVGVRLHYSMDVWIGLLIGYSWSIGIELCFEFRPFFRQTSWHVAFLRWVDCVDGGNQAISRKGAEVIANSK